MGIKVKDALRKLREGASPSGRYHGGAWRHCTHVTRQIGQAKRHHCKVDRQAGSGRRNALGSYLTGDFLCMSLSLTLLWYLISKVYI